MPGPRRSTRSAAERGFTLVEAAVALLILGLAALAAVEAVGGALRTQAVAGRYREAVALAEWRLLALTAMPPDSLPHYQLPRAGAVTLPPHRYTWRAVVRPVDGAPRLWDGAVAVAWDGGQVTLETMVYAGGRARAGAEAPPP